MLKGGSYKVLKRSGSTLQGIATYECKVQATSAYILRARRDRPRDPGPAADAAKPLGRWPTDQDVCVCFVYSQQKYIYTRCLKKVTETETEF